MKTQRPASQFQPLETYKRELFSTPFYQMKFNWNYDEIIKDVRTAVSHVEKAYENDSARNYTTYFEREIHDKYISPKGWCKQLATNLKDTYMDLMHKEFMFELNGLKRSDVHLHLWVNRYTDDHSHNAHNHKGSKLSGTFYVECGEVCAPIIFESPMEYANMLFATMDCNNRDGQTAHHGVPAVQKEFQFMPRNGDVLLWPSYVYHHVPRQQDQEERISISFNLSHPEDLSYGFADDILEEIDYGFLTHDK